jgi:hypothetical protein
MKVELVGKDLVITIPVNSPPQRSKSGKSLIVASTNGNARTNITIDGKNVVVGLNAYIPA